MSLETTKQAGLAVSKPTLKTYLSKYKDQMAAALPKHLTADRMLRIVTTELGKNKSLGECSPSSFIGAVLACCQLGLEPGPLGQAFLVPYKQDCQFILGYKGMIELARRSGSVKRISAQIVYENDHFYHCYGLVERCEHIPCEDFSKRGAIKGAYVVVEFNNGGHQFKYMHKSEIDNIRSKSASYAYWVRSGKKGTTPIWEEYYEDMALKTVIRRMFKYLPISIEIQKAVMYDEAAEVEKQKQAFSAEFETIAELDSLEDNSQESELESKLDKKLST